MEEIAILEFKAECLGLLEQMRKTKQPIRFTRIGKPTAEVVPALRATEPAGWLGCGAHHGDRGETVSPAIEETDWKALQH